MGPRSIHLRVILPVSALILGSMILINGAILLTTRDLTEEYLALIARGHSAQIENLVGKAVSELVAERLLNVPVVVEAKRKATLTEVANYWRENGLRGEVLEDGVRILASPDLDREAISVAPSIHGPFSRYRGLIFTQGVVTEMPAWGWRVVTLLPSSNLLSWPARVRWFIPMVLATFIVLFWAVRMFLRSQLSSPIDQMLMDLERENPIRSTGLVEIDRLGDTINRTMSDLKRHSQQLRMLHDAVIMLNRSGEPTEVLRRLVDSVNSLLGASHGALVVFPSGSDDPSLVLRIGYCQKEALRPACVAFWHVLRDLDSEASINVPVEHPVVGPAVTRCCDLIRNLVVSSLRSSSSRGHDLVLLFANKDGGFSSEDARIVRVLAGDIREAIGRMEAENQLRAALEEKVVLLKEVHHRVKNNLQVISGLLTLQSSHLPPGETRTVFRESQNRIVTMALIHEKLYESEDLARVEFADYLRTLVRALGAAYGARERGIELRVEAAPLPLVVDTAIPCALIANELVSNALKHAFPEGHRGTVRVAFANDSQGNLSLEVTDNGVGLPRGFDALRSRSLGLKLVAVLGEQLGGRWEVLGEAGTSWKLAFREYHEAGTILFEPPPRGAADKAENRLQGKSTEMA